MTKNVRIIIYFSLFCCANFPSKFSFLFRRKVIKVLFVSGTSLSIIFIIIRNTHFSLNLTFFS